MAKFEIKNRWNGSVIFECEAVSIRAAVELAVEKRVSLSDADLSAADLSDVKDDYFKVLSVAKAETLGLYDALMRGLVDGSSYEGECACLVGTIAHVRKEKYDHLKIDLIPNSNKPSERWFLGIRRGDIPQSNPVSAITAEWTREFMKNEKIDFPEYEIVAKLEMK